MARSAGLKGIDDGLKEIIDANMDQAPARRRAREAFKAIQLGVDHCLFKAPTEGLEMKEVYEVNSRRLEIFTKSWIPKATPPKAVICLCHGYGDTCTFFLEVCRSCKETFIIWIWSLCNGLSWFWFIRWTSWLYSKF